MDKPHPTKVADALTQSWVYRLLPESLWPYAQLARWERPIGWQLLMWPGLWSIMLATIYYYNFGDQLLNNLNSSPGMHLNLKLGFTIYPVVFLIGAFVMRGAGCTFNDLADQDIDNQVTRTRSRPLPSGRVTKKQAIIFLILQLLIGLVILLQFNWFAIQVGATSLITIAIYPFMKRITWWPQLFLGFAFSWGALLGWAVLWRELSIAPIVLYAGSMFWVIGYDTIYAHQDKEDDALVGVKSTARLFGESSKNAISLLYICALMLFATAYSGVMPLLSLHSLPAYAGLVIGAIHMFWQINNLDIDNPDQCLKLFKSNNIFGLILFVGLLGTVVLNVLL